MSGTSAQDDWHNLYRDALLEFDPSMVSARIEEARKAIHRAIAQWYAGSGEGAEREQLDNALYFLDLLGMVGSIDVERHQPGQDRQAGV